MIDIIETEIADGSLWELIVRYGRITKRAEEHVRKFEMRSQSLDTITYMIETELLKRAIERPGDWAACSTWELMVWYEQFFGYRAASRLERRRAFLSGDLDRGLRAGKMVRTFGNICNMIIKEMEKR